MKAFERNIIDKLLLIDADYVNMEKSRINEILDESLAIAQKEGSKKWILFLDSERLYYDGKIKESFSSNLRAYKIDLEESKNNGKQNYYILNSLAVCYYCMKDYESAIKYYKKVIELEPEYYQACIDIATVYRNIGEYDNALEFIGRVLENVTEGDIFYQAVEAKGRIMMSIQNYEEANQLLKEIEKDKKGDAEYLEALALSYMYISKYEEAKGYFGKALKLCHDDNLKKCLEVRLELAGFCSDIYGENAVFKNVVARDMVLGLSRDKIQIIKAAFLSMKEQFSISKKYCERYNRQKEESTQRYLDNCILCLKGWSSSTPELSLGASNNNLKKGGGFYIRYNNIGIVIDPGLNFFENLHENNLFIQDIDVVIVSHNHIDHNNDLKKILDMNYQIEKDIIYVVDKVTYSDYIRDFESIEKKCRDNVIKVFPDTSENNRKLFINVKNKAQLIINIFPTVHKCDGSFGFKLILGRKIAGYTSDTKYTKEIGRFFEDSDIIIANISETNREDLMLIEQKETHLGIYGVSELLRDMGKRKILCLLTEFYGGFGDIRIEMASIIQEYVGNNGLDIVPMDIGMTYFIDNGNFLCNNCGGITDKSRRIVARIGKESGKLLCLCENCVYRG